MLSNNSFRYLHVARLSDPRTERSFGQNKKVQRMRRMYYVVFLLLLWCCTANKTDKTITMSTPEYADSFQLKTPDKIVIDQYNKMSEASDSIAPASTKSLVDKSKLTDIMSLVNQLPDEGDMMIKMGDVPLVRVTLFYDTAAVYFDFYNKRIKTPATSFYSTESDTEKKLYTLLVN